MSSETVILQYLADTHSIREISENFPPLNPEEEGVSQSMLAPWSLEAISANTGVDTGEVRKVLEKHGDFSFREVKGENLAVTLAETQKILEPSKKEYSLEAGETFSVSSMMNLHVLQFVQEKCSETGRPVKIEDAIFDLKNSLFLPDDFMPEHLMGMVEGEASFIGDEVRRAYSIKEGVASLYFYQESKSTGFGRIRFLYAASSGSFNKVPPNGKIREIISASFSSIQNEKSYLDFVNSRLIKNVIFNIEQKNTRELKRPMFDPRKIKVLDEMGLVERTGETASIKEGITLDSLKEIYSNAKTAGQELAKIWLASKIKVM